MIRNLYEKAKNILSTVRFTGKEIGVSNKEERKRNRRHDSKGKPNKIRPIPTPTPTPTPTPPRAVSENETGVAIHGRHSKRPDHRSAGKPAAGPDMKAKERVCSLFTVRYVPEKRSEQAVYDLMERENPRFMQAECETVCSAALPVEKAGKAAVRKEEVEYELKLDRDTVRLYDDDDKTIYLYYKHQDTVFVYADDEGGMLAFRCIAVLGERSQQVFADISDMNERLGAILEYAKLLPAQQAFVKKRKEDAKKSVNKGKGADVYKPLMRREQLQMLYSICKDAYPLDIQQRIEALFDVLKDSRKDSAHALKKLSLYLGIDSSPVEQKKLGYNEIMQVLDKHINGCEELKETIAECVIELQHSRSPYYNVLLYGAPGVGKTSVIDAFCELLNAACFYINCGTANPLQVSGSPDYYDNGQESEFVKFLRDMGPARYYVLALDELDKVVTDNREGDINSSLINILERQRVYHDNYLDDDIVLTHCVVICTANDITKIPEHIYNRFEGRRLYMGGYNYSEKAEIGKKFFLPKELEERFILPEELEITDEAMKLMAKEYCDDQGARDMSGCVQAVIRKVLVEWNRGIIGKPFVVDEEYVRSHLKNQKKQQNRIGFV